MRIYTQRFKGKYRTIKDITGALLLFIYMAGSWITYDRGAGITNQAFLIDLPQKKAYILGLIIWPDELYYLSFTLMLGAFGLFICTSLFGRIWCGYTCPHTTMVDVFMMVENIFQGDRNARMKLDSQEMSSEKFIKKALTHISWIALSVLFGFGWVGYFYGAKQLFHDSLSFSVSANGTIWLLGLTGTTYLFAGFLREKVCMHMCPYGRFQSGLYDQDTTVVTYHGWRGETRSGAGDCIDCGKCVVACPMGIDIRDGLQMSCIGCGLCIDACDSVMEKINKPKGLIEYASINSTELLKLGKAAMSRNIFRPKVLIYLLVFTIASASLLISLMMKKDVELQVDRVNTPIFTVTPDGSIRNAYNIIITNKTYRTQEEVCLSIKGVDGLRIKTQLENNSYSDKTCFSLEAGGTFESGVLLLLPYEKLFDGRSHEIEFVLNNGTSVKSVFYVNK